MQIDINADVGEGVGNEVDIMPFISSCNIACGGHAGDLQSMTTVVRLAKKHKVKIGAHPSFPDKKNFGRVILQMTAADLFSSLRQQIRMFQNVLRSENELLHHIKPHGALYNLVAKDEKTAKVLVEVIKSIELPIKLYAPYDSVIAKVAKSENIEVTYEAFADRNYNADLSLVSRQNKNALILKKESVFNHVKHILKTQKVMVITGEKVSIKASTFCVHGDTKNAVEILKYLHQELSNNQIYIR